MSRTALLRLMVSAHQEAFYYGRAAAQAQPADPEAADDARLLRDAALLLADDRLILALAAENGGAR
ncbi:hypothetical protein AB0D56_37945 [Streptomyces sp. NPDC048209]|uniref:hypothetical protein n=1 Tax=Streptomyces sp. NPDC048209 TaxID=3156689 RepID=UPI003416E47E